VSSATAFGPLLASFIVEYSPGTWRDYVWVCVGLTGFNVLALFILYPESNYKRPAYITTTTMMSDESGTNLHEGNKPVSLRTEDFNEDSDHVKAVQKPWKDIWCSFALIDHSTSFLLTTCRPLIMLGCPDVLLAVYVYGTALAAQVILM
jgi:MFS family permease